jgi:hypothetical protein
MLGSGQNPAVDPEPWNLLHDGSVLGLSRAGSDAVVRIAAPHVRARLDGGHGPIVLRLSDVVKIAYEPYDEPVIEDVSAIADAGADVVDAVIEGDELVVYGSRGVLRLVYGALSIEIAALGEGVRSVALPFLREAVQTFWDDWRALQEPTEPHPLVARAIDGGGWSAEALVLLIEAWRTERTSELADAIELLGMAIEDQVLERPNSPAGLLAWRAHFDATPSAALALLQECAFATFDTLRFVEPVAPSNPQDLTRWLEESASSSAAWWRALTAAVATLRDEPADPRIARAMIGMLRSPSDDWFRLDQVAHVAGPHATADETPSFADHALALIETHADAGTARSLRIEARDVSIEADCNGASMVDELLALAARMDERFPTDRPMREAARAALRERPLDR